LFGAPLESVEDLLRVLDPRREHSQAFREERWDGYLRINDGNRFPAGLTERVCKHLQSEGYDVVVNQPEETEAIDTSRMGPLYLGCGPKRKSPFWDHQLEAIMAILQKSRGVVKSPTGSGKTEIMAAAARYFWEERDWQSIIVVPKKGLAAQTVKRLRHYYGNDLSVGQCGDGQRTIGDVTVATAQTLIHFMPWRKKGHVMPPDLNLKELVEKAQVLFLDEAHHASAESWYTIAMNSKALRKFGLSGTPLKNDVLADLRLVGATGEIICNIEATGLIELGINAEPKILVVYSRKASGPDLPVKIYPKYEMGKVIQCKRHLPWAEAYTKGVVENEHHNRAVIRAVEWMVDHGRRVMVLCRRKPHWRTLKKMLEATGLPFGAYWGDTPVFDREDGKRLMQEGSIKVILATTIFDEGEDVPAVNGLVLAEGVKVSINAIQRLGRGMRQKKKGANDLWVVDFCPTCHPRLAEHALERVVAWEGEGYDVRVLEDWPDDDEELNLPFATWDLTSSVS